MKIITYYLPQFHETLENDKWWGNGFTEWTNVKRAIPLFDGHEQPKIPLNNNFYDLTDMDVMVDNIRFLLEHPQMAVEIADNGRKNAEQNDTWDCRILDLLEIINNN